MKSLQKQQGFLSFLTVIMVVILGFIATAVAFMLIGGATANINFLLSESALYLAESGLQKGSRLLLTPTLTGSNLRVACSALSGNSNVTNSAFGPGTFTVTSVAGSPYSANATLSSNITASATTITVNSTSGFASSGRILIDLEAINYNGLSGNSFIGITRGVNNTLAASHTSNTRVSQYQCSIDAKGYVPNASSPIAKRELQQSVALQEAWAVGSRTGNIFSLTHWNKPTELLWNNASFTDVTNRENLRGVSLLSNAEGWAVGEERSNRFNFLHLLGTSWVVSPINGACTNQDLIGVSAVSSQEAWAVGTRFRVSSCTAGNYRYTILRFNGTTWTPLSSATSPSIPVDGNSTTITNLNAVHVINTTGGSLGNFGFAVGNSGRILQYNGSQWSVATSPVAQNLTGVFVVSANQAWAVGASGSILRWQGSWSIVSSPVSVPLNGVAMLDTDGDGYANIGWAVGNGRTIITYNGTSWSTQSSGSGNLFGITIVGRNDAWAVGTSGMAMHWDGSSWTSISSGVAVQLNSIATLPTSLFPTAAWQEIFP